MTISMQQTHGKTPKGEREKIMHKYEFLKHDKNQANGLTMTKEMGHLTHKHKPRHLVQKYSVHQL